MLISKPPPSQVSYQVAKSGIAPGGFLDAVAKVRPDVAGEWYGNIIVSAHSHAGERCSRQIPCYVKAVPHKLQFEGDPVPTLFSLSLASHLAKNSSGHEDLRVNQMPAGVPAACHRAEAQRLKMAREIRFSVNKKFVRKEEILPEDGWRPAWRSWSKEKASVKAGVPLSRSSIADGNGIAAVYDREAEWDEGQDNRDARSFGGISRVGGQGQGGGVIEDKDEEGENNLVNVVDGSKENSSNDLDLRAGEGSKGAPTELTTTSVTNCSSTNTSSRKKRAQSCGGSGGSMTSLAARSALGLTGSPRPARSARSHCRTAEAGILRLGLLVPGGCRRGRCG